MARKKVYTTEIGQLICDAIASEGGDESGWRAGEIGKTTFYKWYAENTNFANSVDQARAQFRKNAPAYQKKTAASRLTEALEDGHVIKWKKTVSTRVVKHYRGDPRSGDVISTDVFEPYEEINIENRPTPQWAIERVLPKPLYTFDQLVAIASEYGLSLVIKDADLFNKYLSEISHQGDKRESREGLTEEAADEIRRKILGMESSTTTTSPLSGEMGR